MIWSLRLEEPYRGVLQWGVPVYVYDYLGGPGYLTEANFSLAERNNFSGRGFEKKDIR